MIKHIVMFKLKEFDSKEEKLETAIKIKAKFEELKVSIEEINKFEVGINISDSPAAFDLVIDSEFNNKEQLKKYSDHPEHKKAVEFNSQFSINKTVVDYEFYNK